MSILQKNIKEILNDEEIIKILRKHQILFVKDLWNLKQIDLKQMGFTYDQIHQIHIKLQLQGIDINKKVYSQKREML